jgi:hypothetical protein
MSATRPPGDLDNRFELTHGLLRRLVGANDFAVLVDEDVVRPVDADVVDLVLAVAQFHDTVDNASWVGRQCSSRRLIRCLSLTIVPDPSL